MTRPELHALVDIVMDAKIGIDIRHENVRIWFYGVKVMESYYYRTFSDFTKAVQEYIKTLETK